MSSPQLHNLGTARVGRRVFCAILVVTFPSVASSQNSIAGRVITEQSAAIAGARVDLLSPVARTTRTDSGGRFVFTGIGAGPFRVRVRQVGFMPVDTSFSELRGDLTLRMERLATRISDVVVRGRWQGIHGIVADSQSLTGLSGAAIRVVGVSSNTRTDSLGGFAVDVKQPGTYVVRVERP